MNQTLAPPMEIPVLDIERLHMLLELDDAADFLDELRATFVDDMRNNLAVIDENLALNSLVEIGQRIHKIKGLSSNLGFFRLVEACIAIEGAIAVEHPSLQESASAQLQTLVRQLKQQFADALKALDDFAAARL